MRMRGRPQIKRDEDNWPTVRVISESFASRWTLRNVWSWSCFFFLLLLLVAIHFWIYLLRLCPWYCTRELIPFIALVFSSYFAVCCLVSTIQLTFIMFHQLRRLDENDPTTQHISHFSIDPMSLSRTDPIDTALNRNRWWNRDSESERLCLFFVSCLYAFLSPFHTNYIVKKISSKC